MWRPLRRTWRRGCLKRRSDDQEPTPPRAKGVMASTVHLVRRRKRSQALCRPPRLRLPRPSRFASPAQTQAQAQAQTQAQGQGQEEGQGQVQKLVNPSRRVHRDIHPLLKHSQLFSRFRDVMPTNHRHCHHNNLREMRCPVPRLGGGWGHGRRPMDSGLIPCVRHRGRDLWRTIAPLIVFWWCSSTSTWRSSCSSCTASSCWERRTLTPTLAGVFTSTSMPQISERLYFPFTSLYSHTWLLSRSQRTVVSKINLKCTIRKRII